MKNLILITVFTLLTSCSVNKVPLTECDHPSRYCKEIREEANVAWKYALLSNNVYKKERQFKTDNLFTLVDVQEDRLLSYYSELYLDNNTHEFVIAFRGTDSSKDFITGNRPLNQQQNRYALEVYDNLRTKYKFDSLIVTGHSLGGGIATHISLNRPKIKSFIFNSSPIFRRNGNYIINERHSIVEKGEILKLTRILGREATQLYTSLNCSKGNPIKQHGIFLLSQCLINIASYSDPTIKEYIISK